MAVEMSIDRQAGRSSGRAGRIMVVAANTGREAIRNRVLYSILFFALFVVAIAGAFGSVSVGPRMKFVKDFSLMSISLFGVVIAVVLGVNLLHKEIGRKTIYNVLSKPIDRWEFVLGKYLGLLATTALVVMGMCALLMAGLAMLEGRIDWGLAAAALATVLELAILTAAAIFFSAIVVTPTLAGLFTAALFVSGRSAVYLRHALYGEISPAVDRAMDVLYWVVPHLNRFNVADQVVYADTLDPAYFAWLAAYSVGYTSALLIVAMLIFERRDIL